ncbi:CDP-alcohol phosphatidyltransferase family protein [Pseudonocardia asaccharolytica]|uniref:CDP-diacylglycerol--serine O-phosphatidyltransferase n=1 Tax=Pseudonocardia asaccharolytica DSM 44247 = NBRC 16224 TaxID=1123024 RepID=A0A511CWZ4_9PSEU|nr:phosphatidylcholine/phosphatidylserine synthase [Pseudonocardia asaccharolytica]GEL17072.1 CDP-diacylglycerol--serine O-phosphatidyltransferase [Pseudonocardia asaccharolytica DSM 44247 = NBRC 16224]
MPSYAAGIRLLPNAVTVLALCAGLSAVQFALAGRFELCVAAVGAAALCDALDGGLARLLDASSKIGAELDSLSDLVSFGVAPALVFYIWQLQGNQFGWIVALIFAVCMALRLARFNSLLEDTYQPPYAKEFFVGVPAPAAALIAGIPLYLWLHFGPGWWSAPLTIALWVLIVGGLMVSRVPTLSLKAVRVSPRLIAPLLVLVGLAAAVLLTVPFLGLAVVAVGYLVLMPYIVYRHRWLSRHPEAWNVPVRQRRAVARAARSTRRLGLRPPLRRRVAGSASAVARAVRRRGFEERLEARNGRSGMAISPAPDTGPTRRGSRRRLGLRRR